MTKPGMSVADFHDMLKTFTRWSVISSFCLASVLGGAACTSPGKKTAIGAGTGAAVGGAIGAATGGWKGAGIGAVIGGAVGGSYGNVLDKRQKELEKVVETRKTQQGLLVQLKNELLFDTNKAVLKPQAIQQLTELGKILAKYEKDRVNIGGFTDSVGKTEYNKELSERRAEAVRSVLVQQGVATERTETFGFGEETPVAPNDTEAGRAKNRRVEVAIQIPKDSKAS
jgi:outer membrane protein OmpA-like peptidoglycan-associated protein